MKKVTATKIYLLITAILLIVMGFLFIFNPGSGMVSVAWFAGLLMLISGFCTLIFSMSRQAVMPNAGSTTLMSVLQIVLGIILLSNRGLAVMTIIVMFGMWIIVEGIQLAILSFDYKKYGLKQWWLMLLLGICSTVLGLYALTHPVATGATISILVGLAIISNGITRMVVFFGINKVQNRIEGVKERVSNYLSSEEK